MSKSYRIFLASSNELADDRIAFGDAVQELNDSLSTQNKNVKFSLYKWERETASFFERRKQDEYNQNIEKCDVFILLYWSKVGKYTEEEYDFAYQRLVASDNRSPVVFVYQKISPLPATQIEADRQSLIDFSAKLLSKDEQFRESYTAFNELKVSIEREISKLFAKGILSYGNPATTLYSDGQAAVPANFRGREIELEEISRRLNAGGRVVILKGEGGMGKTTLAAKYLEENNKQYDYKAWVFCQGGMLNDLKSLVTDPNYFQDCVSQEEILKKLRLYLLNLPANTLLVLDNVNKPDDIHFFRQHFSGLEWHVLITSRFNTQVEGEFPVKHLPEDVAVALFEDVYTENTLGFDQRLRKVLYAFDYNTLLIEIFSKYLRKAYAIKKETLTDLVEKIEVKGMNLTNNRFKIESNYLSNIHKGRLGEVATTDQILEVLYDFASLSPIERYWLVNMALLPAQNYEGYFLENLWSLENDSVCDSFLEPLAQNGWLTAENYTYRLSPVIQALALKKNEDFLGQDAQSLLHRLNHILENDGYNLLNIKLAEAAPYVKPVDHLSKCLRGHPGWDISYYNFCAGVYFNNIGDIVASKKCYENYSSIYQNLLAIDPENLEYKNGLAISYSKLGGIYEQTGDGNNALINYQEQNRISKEIYQSSPENLEYKNGLAISYQNLGTIYNAKGDGNNALINYQEQLRISKEIYQSSPENLEYKNGLAISYQNLGTIYNAKGDGNNALINYQEQLRISKEIYQSSPENLEYKNNLAISLSQLGTFYLDQNEIGNALTHFLESRVLFKELWQATQGQIVQFTYYFALNTDYVTRIVKHLIETDQYPAEQVPSIKESIKAMRQEGYAALNPLAEAGVLQESQLRLHEELADESWYAF